MVVFLLLGILCVVADGCKYRTDYSYSEKAKGWFKVHRIPATWDEARVRCDLEGAVLASPIDLDVITTMKDLMKQAGIEPKSEIFTGTNALFSKGDYYSIEGVQLSQMPVKWMPLEPDNFNNSESCIAMAANGTIADVMCTEVRPYVCYYRAETTLPVTTECGTVDHEYKFFEKTGNCYKFHAKARNWSSAFMACSAEGGYLAIPNDKDEAIYIRDQLFKPNLYRAAITTKFKDGIFLGYLDKNHDGVWTTIHGSRLENIYAEWKPNQPGALQLGQSCGGMYQDGLLFDYKCNLLLPFVCEKAVGSLIHNKS